MASVNEYYEKYWDAPEEYSDPTTPQRQALLSRHVADLPQGAAILDAGCGRGEFCAYFKSIGFAPSGIDLSATVITYARAEHPGIPFRIGEIESLLPDEEGKYDCVFSSEVIEHLFDVGSYLQSINRLLKPGGRYILTTPYHGFVKNVMIDVLNYGQHYDPLGQHIRFFDRKSLQSCLVKYGFKPEVWRGYGRPWPFWKSFFVVSTKSSEL